MKLHGSIDWILGDEGDVWRVRDTDIYPRRNGSVLIYPQSTKYVATQRDPFAAQFSMLRGLLGSSSELVLAVCGYSFGDEHINRSEEHTSELQSLMRISYAVFCLKKKNNKQKNITPQRKN